MSALLDAVWKAHEQANGALKIVRRTLGDAALVPHIRVLVKDTLFDGLPPADIDPTIDDLESHLNDQTVLSLFAAFEAELIDHVVKQESHLRIHAVSITPAFGNKLADLYKGYCKNITSFQAVSLFDHLSVQGLTSPVEEVRKYRNWLAHGKNPNKKPTQRVFPFGAYEALGKFLAAL